MKLLVGLGNPGKEYEKTRHNTGFIILDQIVDDFCNEEWRENKKFKALIKNGEFYGEKIIFLKPQTYMNNSGEAVQATAKFYKIKNNDVWVIYDDLDLPIGTLRIKISGASAGHKGIQSIINKINDDFVRFRIGIAPARPRTAPADKFVLAKFQITEIKKIDLITNKIKNAFTMALKDGLPKAMSIYND